MPAFHDFISFVFFSQQVTTLALITTNPDTRTVCSTSVVAAVAAATTHPDGNLLSDRVKAALSEAKTAVAGVPTVTDTLHALRERVMALPIGGYGILSVFRNNPTVLLRALTAACVDDMYDDDLLRTSLRTALSSFPDLDEVFFLVILAASNAGTLVKALADVDFGSITDLVSFYGYYVTRKSVSARDVLKDFVSLSHEQHVSRTLTLQGMRAVAWNLNALDQDSDEPPQGSLASRILYNIQRANRMVGMDEKTPVVSSLRRLGEAAAAAFSSELQTAQADTGRIQVNDMGSFVTGLRQRQGFAWGYIIISVLVALLVGVTNAGDRDNGYDQLKDSLDVATILLVSVFGVFKMRSDDPNALTNLAAGRRPVANLLEATQLLRGGVDNIQRLLATDRGGNARWAGANGCCYARAVDGPGLETGAASVPALKHAGFFFLESLYKRPFSWDTALPVRNAEVDRGHFSRRDSALDDRGVSFSAVPRYATLS